MKNYTVRYQRPNTCEGCPLHTTSVPGFCPDKIRDNSEYVIFGEAPGKTEIEEGSPFVGKAGFVLRNWLIRAVPLLQMALEKDRVSFRNILHCLPPDNKGRPYPTGETRRLAEAHCAQYRASIAANTVILCGEVPQRFFFAETLDDEDSSDRRLGRDVRGVMGRIGRVIEKDGKRWIFAPHPAYILRQPALVQHGQEALKIASGVDKTIMPDYVNWHSAMREIFST